MLVRVDRSIATEAAYPLLTVVSGVAVTGVGAGCWPAGGAGSGPASRCPQPATTTATRATVTRATATRATTTRATTTRATAATATVVGLGLVCGRGVVERRGYGDRLRFLPVLGTVALVALGLVVLVRGILELT